MDALDRLRIKFHNPPPSYGPVPFLNLNDGLEPRELRWALEELSDKGIAGVFLQPRTGMEVPYLSEEFWKSLEIAIEECRRLKLKVWIYDDYNWPSGAAGGSILKRYPEYRQTFLDYRIIHLARGQTGKIQIPRNAQFLAAKAWRVGTDEVIDILHAWDNHRLQWKAPPGEWEAMVLFTDIFMGLLWSGSCAPWALNEAGALDYLNKEAVKTFIGSVHEAYRQRFGDRFGDLISGVFTDETANYYGWQWTSRLPVEFRKRFHYDLLEHLHEMVFPVQNYVKTRCDYHQLAMDLYVEAYFSQIKDWAERHRLVFTGHMLYEDKLDFIPAGQGGFFSPLRQMQMPGVDFLGDRTGYEPSGILNTPNIGPKALSSLAHCTGKKRALVEIYGGNGWGTSPAQYKNLINYIVACGANFITPHASFLSIKGHRKRDFPASHFVQLPWWRYYKHFAQYISRLSYINSQGRHVADVGILYPLRSFWVEHVFSRKGEVWSEISQAFGEISTALLRLQRDYDFIFEESMLDGSAKTTKNGLKVKDEVYQVVIIPPVTTVHLGVLRILQDFFLKGGTLISLGRLPVHSTELREDPRVGRMIEELFGPGHTESRSGDEKKASKAGRAMHLSFSHGIDKVDWKGILGKALGDSCAADVNISSPFAGDFIYQHRRIGRIDFYFIANLSANEGEAAITLRSSGGAEIWNPENGKMSHCPITRIQNGCISLGYHFHAFEGIFIVSTPLVSKRASARKGRPKADDIPIVISEWRLEPESANTLLIEPWHVHVVCDGKKETRVLNTSRYDSLEAISTANRKLAEGEGVDPSEWTLFMRMARDPDFQKKTNLWPPEGAEFEQKGNFGVEEIPDDMELVYEDLGQPITFFINGCRYTGPAEPCFVWDRSNRRMPLRDWICRGENTIVIRTRMPAYRSLPPATHGLEPVALKGSFGVRNGSVTKARYRYRRLRSWTEMGWPNYSGIMAYKTSFHCPESYLNHRLNLSFEEVRDTIEIEVNRQPAGIRLWPPYKLEITDFVRKGQNDIKIRVSNSLSNLLTRPLPSGLIGSVRVEVD